MLSHVILTTSLRGQMRRPHLSGSPAFSHIFHWFLHPTINWPSLAQIMGTAGTKPDTVYAELFGGMIAGPHL